MAKDDQSRGSLDWTTNFSEGEIDEDLASFQEDEMVQQALQRGVDLKKYGNELENDLRQAEMDSVMQYVENSKDISDLHNQMKECDGVLARMEEMLHGFQADLGSISSEIRHLQEDSLSMSIRLKNRRSVEEKLHKFLDNASVLPQVASNIVSPHINEDFLEAVVTLSQRLKYLEQTTPPKDGSSVDIAPVDTRYGRTILPELERLKVKAVGKIRDYFTNQINGIRKPKSNIQILQQNSLVKYAKLFSFLQHESPAVAEELRTMYVESMGRTILNVFKSYYAQLIKIDVVMATKGDLIVTDDAPLKSMFSSKVDMSKRNDPFSLANRDKVLEQVEKEPILVHVATAEGQRFPYEVLYRSVIKHLVDSATSEFLFVVDFFRTSTIDTFNRIYGRTLSAILENIENYLLNCFDVVGLLLLIKLNHMMRLVMQRRRVPVLDSFFDRISLLLWPRFKQVFDSNMKSIKGAYASSSALSAVKRNATGDLLAPHYVSRRYAQLIASIMTLQSAAVSVPLSFAGGGITGSGSTEHVKAPSDGSKVASTDSSSWGIGGGGETMLQQDMSIMRAEMIALLERLANNLPTIKEKIVFLVNNYDQILGVFQESGVMFEDVQKFEDLLMQQRELFAEEEIKYSFPRLMEFVIRTEQAMNENSAKARASLDEVLTESIVREFASNWRTGIQQINDNVLAYFANFRNGMEILKQVLTQLLLYYTRFQDIIKKSFPRPPMFTRDIVSTATIMMEIKRYNRTF